MCIIETLCCHLCGRKDEFQLKLCSADNIPILCVNEKKDYNEYLVEGRVKDLGMSISDFVDEEIIRGTCMPRCQEMSFLRIHRGDVQQPVPNTNRRKNLHNN